MTIEIPKKEPLNIVPFIDIMLVLLAMVLSVSTFIAKVSFVDDPGVVHEWQIPARIPKTGVGKSASLGSP